MTDTELFFIARGLHVLGVVLWIGGVGFVTLVLLPAIKQLTEPEQRLALFEQLEHRFSWQAKVFTLITGISGFYMLFYMNAWQRYLQPEFWWLHLMTLIWLFFTLVLFVLEPLVLHHWFNQRARANSDATFKLIHALHGVLLLLSLIAVFAAVTGSHGFQLL